MPDVAIIVVRHGWAGTYRTPLSSWRSLRPLPLREAMSVAKCALSVSARTERNLSSAVPALQPIHRGCAGGYRRRRRGWTFFAFPRTCCSPALAFEKNHRKHDDYGDNVQCEVRKEFPTQRTPRLLSCGLMAVLLPPHEVRSSILESPSARISRFPRIQVPAARTRSPPHSAF